MKNITRIFRDNNLSGRENVLTLIKHYAHKKVTGKSILNEADIKALINGFRAKNAFESQEYNKYKNMWEEFKIFEKSIYMMWLAIRIELLSINESITMFHYEEPDKIKNSLDKEDYSLGSSSFLYTLENTWLDYDETIHHHIFLSLPKNTQNQFLEICDCYEWEPKSINKKDFKYYPDIYNSWIKEEKKQLLKIEKMIETGEIVVENKVTNFLHHKHERKIITGTSLYFADDSILFVKEYKKQVEELAIYGYLFYGFKKWDFEEKIGIILSFQNISKKMSNIIETEATNLPIIMITELRDIVDRMNNWIQSIENKIEDIIWMNSDTRFKIQTSFEKERIDLLKVKVENHELIKTFNYKMSKSLGTEWSK